jgi:hypothetical protein
VVLRHAGGVDEEARRIWAELQQRDWVSPDLTLDEVMEKLAYNWEPWELLGREHETDDSPIQVRIRDLATIIRRTGTSGTHTP